jgi:hypothetical protein
MCAGAMTAHNRRRAIEGLEGTASRPTVTRFKSPVGAPDVEAPAHRCRLDIDA